jgi:hypothetical protein
MQRTIAENIRAAAKREGLGVEQFRQRYEFSNGTFYDLLEGKPPRTLKVLQQLRRAGVSIPRGFLNAGGQ